MKTADKLTEDQYRKNFEELIPAFTKNAAVAEANRCLYCYDSPCTKACPTHIDIPTFIKKISTGNLKGSAKTIYESNWIALTCAKACPVDDLCEGACVMHDKGEKPIEIGRLQRFAIENYFDTGMPKLFEIKPRKNKSIGIVGSGPAGLACAAELSLLGYKVKIYESNKVPGGLNTWGIAPYKMTRADSLREIELIKSFGVEIQTGVTVGEDLPVNELFKTHDAVFIGIGLGESGLMKIPGENLDGVVDALKFIEEVKLEKWSEVDVGKNVTVIGGGNTAIDAATEAMRLGAENVMIIYRRGVEDMPANEFEFDLAKKDGIHFLFQTSTVEILGNAFVEGIKCVKMKLGEKDKHGRRRPVPIEGSEFLIEVDMVISAIGQKAKFNFLNSIDGLVINNNEIVVNKKTFQTGNEKVFAGGDCINGGMEVVNAAYDGKHAAHGIDSFLSIK